MPNNNAERIIAAVSPRSIGGVSLFDATMPITQQNVRQFYSQEPDITAASNELRRLGFEILQEGPVTISIAGSRKLFEDVFSAKLTQKKAMVMAGQESEFLASDQLLQAPGALANLIEGIAIAHPAEYFAESPLPPMAQPEPGAYRDLFVPDEVGLIINADRVHGWEQRARGSRWQ